MTTTHTPVAAPAFAAGTLPLYVGRVTPTPEAVMPAATQAALNRLYRTAPAPRTAPVQGVALPTYPRVPAAPSPFAPSLRTRLAHLLRPRYSVSDRTLLGVAVGTALLVLGVSVGACAAPSPAPAPAPTTQVAPSTQPAQYASLGYYALCEGVLTTTETASTRTTTCTPSR